MSFDQAWKVGPQWCNYRKTGRRVGLRRWDDHNGRNLYPDKEEEEEGDQVEPMEGSTTHDDEEKLEDEAMTK